MKHHARLIVAPYQSDWPKQFANERFLLNTLFQEARFQIEHVGSTAVPGLCAKPIIDIMIGAPSLREIEERIQAMVALGYEYISEHEQLMPLRRFFAKPIVRPRNFHVHAVTVDSAFWCDHILFRDTLRNNQDLCLEYAAIKLKFAQQFGDDRDAYTQAKGPFISAVLSNARASNP